MDLIGIDKTVIKNFTVKSVDINKLQAENKDFVRIIKNSNSGIKYFNDSREDNFEYIHVNDNATMFNNLSIGVKKVGNNNIIKYCILDMSIKQEGQNNLIPLTIGAYKQKLDKVVKYIYERYGVKMYSDNVKFESVELNATIELNNEFNNYLRVLKILTYIAPATYKIKSTYSTDNEVGTFKGENKSIGFKFYNKSKQLDKVYNLDMDKNILRLEYTLKNDDKVLNVFGNNEVDLITDDEIKEFIRSQFTKDFINRIDKFKTNNKSKLVKIAKEHKERNKQWIKPFIMYLMNYECSYNEQLLVDIEDLQDVFETLDKKHGNRWEKTVKNIKNIDGFVGVNDKIMEIFDKINGIK